jgi:hypothetical protein
MAVGLPLKTTYADGDVYAASDVNDTNGTINITAAPFAAGKNKFINGDFFVNQRAFTSTTTSLVYTFDRWRTTTLGDGTATFTAQTFTPGTAPVSGYEGKNYLRIVTASQTAVGTLTDIRQRIESVRTLAGQTATVSFWAKAASGTPKVAVELNQVMGDGGSPSSSVQTYVGQATLSSSWARYSLTVAVPSLSGKTIGTNENSDLMVNFIVSAGSDFNARTGSLGIQSNTFEFWGMQIEAGSVATAFQTATGTIGGELALCQRYYVRLPAFNTNTMYGNGFASSTTSAMFVIPLPVTLRTSPGALDYSNNFLINDNVGTSISTSVVANNVFGSNVIEVYANVTSGLTQYRPYRLISSSTSGYLAWSAEL